MDTNAFHDRLDREIDSRRDELIHELASGASVDSYLLASALEEELGLSYVSSSDIQCGDGRLVIAPDGWSYDGHELVADPECIELLETDTFQTLAQRIADALSIAS